MTTQPTVEELEEWSGFTVPDWYTFDNFGRCRSCGQRVAWCITLKGKKAPLDADGTSHFATCPDAGSWRRKSAG
jgi:hypothetical protein